MSASPPPLNKCAREACYKARDAFYQCVREQAGFEFTVDSPIPSQCKKLRLTFQSQCPASWVKHFDQQQEAAARRAKQLASQIQQTSLTSAGTLAGKAQR